MGGNFDAGDQYPTVSVIVLNYNGQTHLHDCFEALMRLEYPLDRIELLLVDNASTDGSPAWVAAHYPIVRISHNGANLGFAAGNTAGAHTARGEWIAFLNPDTRVAPNWLSELVKPVGRDPDVVCVASKILTWDGRAIDFADAAINFMGWGCQPGYGHARLNEYDRAKELLFACGGAMLIKRSVFLEVGGFDDDYFAYYEDVDLGWRLWLMGYKVVFAPKSIVYHRHHGSWDKVSNVKRWLLAERNTLFTIIKNYDDDSLARALPASLLLMLQRAYIDLPIDPSARAGVTPNGQVFGLRYYLNQTWQLIRRGELPQLRQRVRDEVNRRLSSRRLVQLPAGPRTQPQDGLINVPAIALSRLAAGRAVQHALATMLHKRTALQAARRRSDREVFPLFQWALISNFGDKQFIQAMQVVIARFGLAQLFAPRRAAAPLDEYTRELSRRASAALLDTIDRALVLSGVPDNHFELGGPAPEAMYRVPMESVHVLIKMNQVLWSLPDAPLNTVLDTLLEQCRRALSAVTTYA